MGQPFQADLGFQQLLGQADRQGEVVVPRRRGPGEDLQHAPGKASGDGIGSVKKFSGNAQGVAGGEAEQGAAGAAGEVGSESGHREDGPRI